MMRGKNRGMTLVEVVVAMTITLIIGGTASLFLRSGLDLDQSNTIHASNQQSLRAPLLELVPLIERASSLDILENLPAANTLAPDEVVAYMADPADPTKLDGEQNNMYLRTRNGDRILPGFSHVTGVRFEKVVPFVPSQGDSTQNQAVRVTLTAKNSGRELVYSTDVRPLFQFKTDVGTHDNKGVPVEGADSGAFLKINVRDLPVFQPFIVRARKSGSNFVADFLREGATALPFNRHVVGYFCLLAGSPFSCFEYEWRLYDVLADIDVMKNYKVIGKDFLDGNSYYKARYEDRFRENIQTPSQGIDTSRIGLKLEDVVKVKAPTGTTALRPFSYKFFTVKSGGEGDADLEPKEVMELHKDMLGKFLVLAVRREGGNWSQSGWYKITEKAAPPSAFFKDLMVEVTEDLENLKNPGYNGPLKTLIKDGALANMKIDFKEGEQGTYMSLHGSGFRPLPAFAKELEEKYFGRDPEDGSKRDPEFCLENYTLWIDAKLDNNSVRTWAALFNANISQDRAYGYAVHFDPGLEAWHDGIHAAHNILNHKDYFFNRLLGIDVKHSQGIAPRLFNGLNDSGATSDLEQPTPNNGPLKRYYGVDNMTRYNSSGGSKDFNLSGHSSYAKGGSYYLWGDIQHRGNAGPGDAGPFPGPFAVDGDEVWKMREHRYVTEINIITQTKKDEGSEGKRRPEALFYRIRVYDKKREYNDDTEEWFFPAGTGRSKVMWFGFDGLKWSLPDERAGVPANPQKGDVVYTLSAMKNKLIQNGTWDKGYALGKKWGMRIYGAGAVDAEIYWVDIAKGLPLDERLPNGKTVKEMMGDWDPEKPYDLKEIK